MTIVERCLLGLLLTLAILGSAVAPAAAATFEELVQQLGADDFSTKSDAAEALGRLGDTRAVMPLQALSDGRLYLGPDKRVVMLTMHADKDLIDAAIKAGVVGYLTKDCSTDEVIEAVRMAANGETALSPQLAKTMLSEVRKIDEKAAREEDRLVTKREEEVLQLIADGCSTPEVAQRLYISQKTVKNHLASIYEKLNARDRTQAVLLAVRMGIVKLT